MDGRDEEEELKNGKPHPERPLHCYKQCRHLEPATSNDWAVNNRYLEPSPALQ